MAETALHGAEAPSFRVRQGTCYVLFAYEACFAIDLEHAERLIGALTQRANIRHKRRAPSYFEYRPAPLRITQGLDPIALGAFRTAPTADLLLYDFGAVSVSYTVDFQGGFPDLLQLSESVYENPALLEDSRRRVEQLFADIRSATTKAAVADVVETYAIFQVISYEGPSTPGAIVTTYAQELAQVLRAERTVLSREEVQDTLGCRISFSSDDVALIDWEGAILFDRDADDVRDVLEFANVELLEMRYVDQRLDDALDQAYDALSRRTWLRYLLPGATRADLRRIGQLEVDSAILFEGVNNTLKLLGDQYLARVYRLVGERFHMAEWDASILRKLQTLESIYQKLSDFTATRRMELLEWIIILLIAVSIVLPMLGLDAH